MDLTDLDFFEKQPFVFDYLSEKDGPTTLFEIESAIKRPKNEQEYAPFPFPVSKYPILMGLHFHTGVNTYYIDNPFKRNLLSTLV